MITTLLDHMPGCGRFERRSARLRCFSRRRHLMITRHLRGTKRSALKIDCQITWRFPRHPRRKNLRMGYINRGQRRLAFTNSRRAQIELRNTNINPKNAKIGPGPGPGNNITGPATNTNRLPIRNSKNFHPFMTCCVGSNRRRLTMNLP